MREFLTLSAGIAMLLPANATAMTVAEFLAKADALKQAGVMAITSSDIGLLRDEVKAAGTDYRAALAAEAAAGRKPSSCPPPVGKTGISSTELITYFNSLPANRRGISVKAAFPALMKQRFPCR